MTKMIFFVFLQCQIIKFIFKAPLRSLILVNLKENFSCFKIGVRTGYEFKIPV